ncbi:4Fe-4S binding protein [Geobacter pickeringii]|uniref:4Fe-4S binding protein n=1 Tax=Geobacter pickeringii TaxID=345632 RepID=UPI000A00628F|nr:4Fe-4S binding protein [Geobacter pickeringii]
MIEIDSTRCKGCGRCVAACPNRFVSLETAGTRKCASVISTGCCTRCGRCVTECPFGVITIPPPASSAR